MKSNLFKYLFVFLFFGFYCNREEPTVVDPELSKTIPDQEMLNFQAKISKKGNLEAIINAGHMKRFSRESLALFDRGVHIDFYDETGQVASELTADGGELKEEQNDVKLTGNVVVVSDSGFTLFTEELFYYEYSDKIFSKVDVLVVTEDGDTLRGKGFESDTKMNFWEIKQPYDGVAHKGVDLSYDRFDKEVENDTVRTDSTIVDSLAAE